MGSEMCIRDRSEDASEAGSKVREGATDLSEAASRAGETVSRALE